MHKLNWNEWPKTSGIYCITNIINNKKYIGSAVNLNERLNRHYRELIKNEHFNIHLQSSWTKYGENSFMAEILEEWDIVVVKTSEDYQKLLKLEDSYIIKYNCLDELYGYNNRTSDTFPILKQESIEKRVDKQSLRKIKIMAFKADTGEFYKEWSSITEAAFELKDQTTNISFVKNKPTRSLKGYVLITSDTYDPNKCYKQLDPDRSWTEETKEKYKNNCSKSIKIYVYTDKNNFILYRSCTDSAKALNLRPDSISHILKDHNNIIKYKNYLISKSEIDLNNYDSIFNNAYEYTPGIVKNQFSNKIKDIV